MRITKTSNHRIALALTLVFLTAMLVPLMPTITYADNHDSSGKVSINATGNATPIGDNKGNGNSNGKTSGSPTTATLALTGSAYSEGNGNQIKLMNLTGSLQIGSTTYTLSKGQGEENSKGTLEIQAKSNNGTRALELQLHGSVQGNNVVFNSKESKLASLYFLALSGQETLTLTTSSSSSRSNTNPECTGHEDEECTNSTVTVTVNQTLTQTTNNTIIVTQTNNQTVTQTIASPITTQTVTETNNQTVTQTQTVTTANTTITVTATTIVANTTITVTTT